MEKEQTGEKEVGFETVIGEMLEDPEFKEECEILALERLVSHLLLEARKKSDLTQKELSSISGVNQADISRIENGNGNPSIKTLKRLADAMGYNFICNLVPKEKVLQKT